ncbi:MAG: type II toxin-antitoxin system Phd/YefM family antitoxin [Acidimicrobiia bacterium]|nr:type II toxin-antitoxin system Phd/YefM family antitoxin [Acidimicrobiia bacterium]
MIDHPSRPEGVSPSTVGVRDLRAALATHLDRVEAGATLVVRRGGRAVARLVPMSEPTRVERGLEEMARLGLVERPRSEPSPASPDAGATAGARPLPVDVRVDRIVRQVRG